MHVKKGDKVIVIAGKEKGKSGTIARVIPSTNKVVVEGLNIVKRHTRPRKAGEKGGIAEFASPLDASNVKLADKKAKAEKPKAKKTATKEA
jgi:large subunit ribosomal protein L24